MGISIASPHWGLKGDKKKKAGPGMESCAANHGIMCSSCRFPLQVQFAYFIWPDLAGLPGNISVRYSHQVAQLPSDNCHGFASEALSLRFVVGGLVNNRPFTETWRRRQCMGLFHVFSTYFCQVSDGSERGRLSLMWNSCRFAGIWRFPRTAMAQWQKQPELPVLSSQKLS